MTDVLFVTYDRKNNGEVGLCVSRLNDDKKSHTILKMEFDDQATAIYRLLTEQMTKSLLNERITKLRRSSWK
jgi:hypothetical protein